MPESTAVGTDHPARRIQKIFRSTMKLRIYGRYGMSWQALTETIRISAVLKSGNKKMPLGQSVTTDRNPKAFFCFIHGSIFRKRRMVRSGRCRKQVTQLRRKQHDRRILESVRWTACKSILLAVSRLYRNLQDKTVDCH